ncbi:MAG: hypothetical protein ABSE51_06015 [Terracidiphilus sp.]
MNQPSIISSLQYSPEYPPPPRVHWLVLLLVWWTLGALIGWLVPSPYQNLLNSLVVDAWAFYLCLWIRTLDPDARCIFWCDAYVVVELACAAMTIRQNPSAMHERLTGILGLTSAVLGIATIYLIRADLEKHYNEREPIGLHFSLAKTFFFSFLYFQSQLYDIAEYKKRQAKGIVDNPSRTLTP